MSPRLLIVTDCAHGGTFHVATLLVESLRDTFAVAFAAPFAEGGAAAFGDLGVDLHATPFSYENLDRSTWAHDTAAALLDATRPDIILSVDGAELSSLLALKAVAHERGIPTVIIVNLLSADVLERFARYLAESKASLAAAAAVVFVSEASRQRCESLLPDLRFAAHAIPNSVPDVFFAPRDLAARARTRKALGVGDNELMILTGARIEERKGQALGIAALEHLKTTDKPSPFRWFLAGRAEDWDRKKLEGTIATAGVGDHFTILGERDDMRDLLDASDLFVLTSYAEGMPLCIIEALAKGVPVIATAIDGIVEQVDARCGVLLPPPGDDEAACVAALTTALETLAQDRERLTQMGEAARARAQAHFHPTIGGARYRALLDGVPPGAPRATAPDRSLRPGASLDFADPRQIWNHLEDGWARCERGGIWTDGTVSTLRLRIAADSGRLQVMVDVTPFDRRHSRTTLIFANGRPAGRWRARPGRNWLAVTLDPAETGRDVVLRFENPGAVRPCDIGLSGDWRQLALFFRRAEIERAVALSWFKRIGARLRISGGAR